LKENKNMIQAPSRLEKILNETPKKLLSYSEDQASAKANPKKWSKKEILGHLIDSAANNHQRFVRMQIENNIHLPQYQQDEWVNIQHYNSRNWIDLVKFWLIFNTHILHIMKTVDETKLLNAGEFPEYGIKTLQFLIDDYVDHMEHHMKAILV
jgi:hypothetical protein